ncbi:formyltransferase family protein [Helicobacter pullorum]|uniref:Formyl transferase N-terminal domain-containing protein n=1 Tax=Helicobacter pullorum TaxID=35818 RepID=A0A0N0LTI6_9HELI|nr:formyltransferase family protein [Helicobacter pullorum]KPH55951.1 hypothetical protein HPU229334_05320 [Helicobacter pullorum]OCR15851.1 hypothetical protein BA915_04350 [Helicobacter pullorum]
MICIAGKNDIAYYAIKYLLTKIEKREIVVAINQTDNGVDTWQKSVCKFAKEQGLDILSLEDLYRIKDLLFISLEFDRLVNTKKFASKRLFNIHFSKLPKYKGMYTSIFPILYGEKTSGVTLHKIDEGIDTGDIIAQKSFKISLQDSARDLYFKYIKYAKILFRENIFSLIDETYTLRGQNYIESSYFSKSSIDFKNIRIDFKKTSFEIHNQLRAFIFKEYQLPCINGFEIVSSILSDEIIAKNSFEEKEEEFIISGIDGFKIVAKKALE